MVVVVEVAAVAAGCWWTTAKIRKRVDGDRRASFREETKKKIKINRCTYGEENCELKKTTAP